MWLPGDDLGCDTCDKIVYNMGARGTTLTKARARGWHVYEGPSAGGTKLSSHLCPGCVGTPRSLPPAAKPMTHDQLIPLFSEAA